MKGRLFLAGTATALALAGCQKNNGNSAGPATAVNDTVTITQANPPPGGTWADVVNATSDGFMMGNPNAKVKLVEIGALSCPHCKKFEDEGAPILADKYVKSGNVSWEFRTYMIHGIIDMPVNLIAQCNGLKSFFPMVQAIYHDQEMWMGKIEKTPQDKIAQLQTLPTNQMFQQLATIAGLQDWAAARGIPQTKANQCLSDQKMIDHQVQITNDVNNQYPNFEGTPSFVINGKLLASTAGWDKLQPQLDAALK